MDSLSRIKIGEYKVKSTKHEIKRLKVILDKLEVPHTLDDISFHNTLLDLNRMKSTHNTNVWKVERDGSLSLTNRFGHNGRFDYRHIDMPCLLEFQFVDLSILDKDEIEFLDDLLYKVDGKPEAFRPKVRQKDILSE